MKVVGKYWEQVKEGKFFYLLLVGNMAPSIVGLGPDRMLVTEEEYNNFNHGDEVEFRINHKTPSQAT